MTMIQPNKLSTWTRWKASIVEANAADLMKNSNSMKLHETQTFLMIEGIFVKLIFSLKKLIEKYNSIIKSLACIDFLSLLKIDCLFVVPDIQERSVFGNIFSWNKFNSSLRTTTAATRTTAGHDDDNFLMFSGISYQLQILFRHLICKYLNNFTSSLSLIIILVMSSNKDQTNESGGSLCWQNYNFTA